METVVAEKPAASTAVKFENRLKLVGRMTKNKEGAIAISKSTARGNMYVSSRINVPYEKKTEAGSEWRDNIFWFTAWSKVAEAVLKFQDGDIVELNGYIRISSFPNKETGKRQYKQEIIASSVQKVS